MISNEKVSISQFAASAQRRLIITRIIGQVVLYLGALLFVASVLNILFIFLPFSLIIYLFDLVVVSPVFIPAFFCILFIYVKRISKLDAIRYLEKQSTIEHAVVSIAFEMRNNIESIFTKRVADTAAIQIKTLKTLFPSYCTINKMLVFCLGMVLFIMTSLVQNSAIHYMSISGILNNSIMSYIVKPGTISIPKGKNVVVSMECNNMITASCWLLIKDISSGKTERKLIHKNSNNQFSDTLDNVTKDIQYQFIAGNRKINNDSILVVHPPVIQSITLKITRPDYMNRVDTVTISGNGNASVYRGSNIAIEIESSFLKSANVVANNDTIRMITKKRRASVSLDVPSNEKIKYFFTLIDTMGQCSDTMIHYEIAILPDDLPVVQITEPAFNKNLTPEMVEKIAFEAIDDFGISNAELHYFISSDRMNILNVKLSPNKIVEKYQKEYSWDLNKTGLYPGDTLFYYVRVSDNYPYRPFHSAYSDTFFFRIPSFDEITKSINDKEMHAERILKQAIDKAGEIRKTAEKVQSESNRSSENPSWEQIQLLDEMKEKVNNQHDSLQKAIDELNQSADELRKQGVLGKELADKMEQIEKMIEKLVDKYGDSLFTNLDKNQKITAKQLQEAVEKAKELLPDLEEALDNTLKYLDALQKDRELAQLSMKAENLARQQAALNERETGDRGTQQDQVVKESGVLNNDIRKTLDQNISESVDSLLKQIDSIGKQIKAQKKNSSSNDTKVATAMSQSLMSLSDMLQDMMSNAQMAKSEIEMKKVLAIAGMLLSVNNWIEELGKNNPDDKIIGKHFQVFADALRKVQSTIDSLELIPPEMLSSMTKQVNNCLIELQKIIIDFDSFQMRNLDSVSSSLLVLANDIMSFISQTSQQQNNGNSSGGGGMMSKIRKLSQRQSSVNAATSAMLRALMESKQGIPSGSSGMSSDGDKLRVDAARKAAMGRQKEIADELAELQKEYENLHADAQIVKRLEELKKEAQRLTDMFTAPSSMLEEKQNKFLNRMLQSALSVNRQDEEKEERKSESAKTIFSEQSSKKLQVPSTPDAFYLMKRKALQGNFPESYRSAINAYLDSLGVLYLKDK